MLSDVSIAKCRLLDGCHVACARRLASLTRPRHAEAFGVHVNGVCWSGLKGHLQDEESWVTPEEVGVHRKGLALGAALCAAPAGGQVQHTDDAALVVLAQHRALFSGSASCC